MMHQQAACHCNATCYHTSLGICAILSERSEGGQPLGQRIMRPRKSNNGTLRNDKTCSWRGQFELLGNTWSTNELSTTGFAQDGILLQVGMEGCIGLFGAYSLIPDHMSLWHLYMVTLASVADPRLFDPRVGDDKTYITTMSMQQTSVHGRTTSCHKTGWEDRTWWCPSLSSGFSTWPQWNARSFFQDHLWVICTTEAGIKTFLWFLACALWLLLSQRYSCLAQFHLRGRGWTNFSPLFMTGMIQDHHLHALQDF